MSDAATRTPAQTLTVLRMIWFALLMGQVTFLFVVIALMLQSTTRPQPNEMLGWIAAGMVIVLTPLGYFLRNQIYKSNWQGDVVTPGGYLTGNLILLAMMEGAAFMSLIATMLNGAFGWWTAPAVAAMAVQVVNFPTGGPMNPHADIFRSGVPERNHR